MKLGLVTALLALTVGSSAGVSSADRPEPKKPQGAGRLLTFDDVNGGARIDTQGRLPTIAGWMPDGSAYLALDDNGGGAPQLMLVEPRTGKRTPFYDATKMAAALAAATGGDGAGGFGGGGRGRGGRGRAAGLMNETKTAGLVVTRNDVYLERYPTAEAIRLTESPDEIKTALSFSPDSKRIAFVRQTASADGKPGDNNGDLCVVDIDHPKVERVLAHAGPNIRVGTLDWVYEEEVFDRATGHDGYAWSPDSSHIAFFQLDDSTIKPYTIPDNLPRIPDSEAELYPLAGEANPTASVGIADADAKAPSPRFVDLSRYPADDRIIARVGWAPDSHHVVFQVENRIQTALDLDSADVGAGSPPAVLVHETNAGWIDILGQPTYLKDGSFLWLSDRSGHRQILHCAADGKLIATLQTGDADVRELHGADREGRFAYYTARGATNADSAAYRVAVDGSTPATAVTGRTGGHQADFDPTFHFLIDRHSDIVTPTQIDLLSAETGEKIKTLAENTGPLKTFADYHMSTPQMLEVTARDGKKLSAMMIRPPDFDPTKKYPVYCPVYAGPGIPTVENRWGQATNLFYQLLAQQGYIIWFCDNRSSRDTPADSWPIRKRLGECELRDIEDGISYLKSQPYIDAGRIGISGWSYGGFMTEYALTHSKSFKVGIAGAGVADWRLYDTIYTERYMDTPTANPDGYRATSPVTAAADTSGRLLILHGMMDDNVHMQNSISLIYALERAGIPFDMMLYPSRSSRHGIGDRALSRHLQMVEYEFIKKNL